eukprot:Clim_evm2s27 gene=Clim_evmTU2s27
MGKRHARANSAYTLIILGAILAFVAGASPFLLKNSSNELLSVKLGYWQSCTDEDGLDCENINSNCELDTPGNPQIIPNGDDCDNFQAARGLWFLFQLGCGVVFVLGFLECIRSISILIVINTIVAFVSAGCGLAAIILLYLLHEDNAFSFETDPEWGAYVIGVGVCMATVGAFVQIFAMCTDKD